MEDDYILLLLALNYHEDDQDENTPLSCNTQQLILQILLSKYIYLFFLKFLDTYILYLDKIEIYKKFQFIFNMIINWPICLQSSKSFVTFECKHYICLVCYKECIIHNLPKCSRV